MADAHAVPANAIEAVDTTMRLCPDATYVYWYEPYLSKRGHENRRYHREGYPALITGTNLSNLADPTVSECGPAPSKDGTPVYVNSINYYYHGIMHRDDGPSYTDGTCTCFTGICKRVRMWGQHGKCPIDRPFRVTCNVQSWVSRTRRPTTVYRDGRLLWPVSTPERYTYWSHARYALPDRLRFRAIASSSSVSGLANLITWWVDA
jgi:hypothetical protein